MLLTFLWLKAINVTFAFNYSSLTLLVPVRYGTITKLPPTHLPLAYVIVFLFLSPLPLLFYFCGWVFIFFEIFLWLSMTCIFFQYIQFAIKKKYINVNVRLYLKIYLYHTNKTIFKLFFQGRITLKFYKLSSSQSKQGI